MNTTDDPTEKTFPYGTKEEAERRFDEKGQKRRMTLCPLMNATCSADCVCYVKPKVTEIGTAKKPMWDCKGGYCNCYSLVGPD